MMQRMKGTLRPGRKAGVLALAVLLLTCVLMAGAVSAETSSGDITGPVGGVSLESDSAVYNLTLPGTYVITKNLEGTDGKDTVILISADDVILKGSGKIIDGNFYAKYGIKVDTGCTNPVIQDVTIVDVVTTGIRIGTADSGSTDCWNLNNVLISGVTIGDIGSTSSKERVTGIMVNFTESTSDCTLRISDIKLTGKIDGYNAHGMRLYAGDGDIFVNNVELTSASSVSGDIWAHGIGVWSSGTGNVTIDSCNLLGSLSTGSENGLNAFGVVASVSSGNAVITNCQVSGNVYAKNYAYGLYADTDLCGNVIIRDSIVAASMSTSNSNYIYGVALCDWWINNNDDLSEFTLENTTIRNFADKQKAVRILSAKEDGSSYVHTGDLKINLINNTIVSDKPSSIAFSLENNLEKSELNLNGNVLSLTGSDSTVLSFATTSCDYTGKIHNNDITLGPSGSFIKSSSGSIADNISNINWVDLTPGVNVPDIITWTGDDVNGWALVLGEKASGTGDKPKIYTFTQDVTISSMTVSAKDAVIDGNKGTCTLTLSGTAGYQGVITVENGATLQNLNVVAAEDAKFGTAIKVVNGNLIDSTIDLTKQNAQPSSGTGRMSAIAVFVEDGTISRNTILAGNSDTSSSQCVVVNGDGVTVSGNTLTTGKSAAKTEEGKRTSGSVGIRLSSGASGITTITDNRITSQQEGTMNNGIAADGVSGNVEIKAFENTFVLDATEYDGGAFYVNPTTDVTTVTINAEKNTVKSAASFICADKAEGATNYAISGQIENNDFAAADKGLVSAKDLTLTLEKLDQSGNSGLITDPSESLTVDPGESKITVIGAKVDQDGGNAIITFIGYKILITNVTVTGSDITYNHDSTATVTHNTVRHMDDSPTDIEVKLLITDMSKLAEISTPKATIGDDKKAQLAAQKITPVSVVDIHHEGEPGFDQITLTISGVSSSGKIIGFHVGKSGVDTSEVTIKDGKHIVTFTDLTSASPFGIGVISDGPQPPSSSSGGNMDNAYRVLFNDGATTLSVVTDLSSGDKLTKPETPVKDGYTFAGWYKDSACTQGWDFETGISGDMTLYAKWTAAGSSGETEATPTATSTAVTTPQPTKTQTAAATTSAPQATTAAGVSPTLTQAPAPVAGALFGLLAAGVLLRRRFQ